MMRPLKGTDPGIIRRYVLKCVLPPLVLLITLLVIYRIFLLSRKTKKRILLKRWLLPLTAATVCLVSIRWIGICSDKIGLKERLLKNKVKKILGIG